MIECICIDDKNRPNDIPASKWIKAGDVYHITFVAFCLPQKISGVSLYEKPLDETCLPYEYFSIHRFAILESDKEKFHQLCKDCTDLDDLAVENIIAEANLEMV